MLVGGFAETNQSMCCKHLADPDHAAPAGIAHIPLAMLNPQLRKSCPVGHPGYTLKFLIYGFVNNRQVLSSLVFLATEIPVFVVAQDVGRTRFFEVGERPILEIVACASQPFAPTNGFHAGGIILIIADKWMISDRSSEE